MPEIYDFSAKSIDGAEVSLSRFRGQALLIVNTASKCGFTPQYEGLEKLQQTYGQKGLTVLGFPCDQFGHQEPGDEAEIKTFCTTKYDVSFPMFAKIAVNGADTHPLWAFLKWNFTKFLVAPDGTVAGRFAPTTKPESLAAEVEKLLPAS
jgi:glutathione peroxidase